MTRKIAPPPKVAAPEAPEHLSERSKALWAALVPARALSPGRLALLQVGLEALDRAAECRTSIETEGLVTVTAATGARHVSPLAKLERDSRALFARIWGDLALGWDHDVDGAR